MKTRIEWKISLSILAVILVGGCNPFRGNQNSNSNAGGLSIYPGSTSVAVNQNVTFQVSGGTPPYQFQASGVGWIDANGVYRPGAAPGQAEILVSDSVGNSVTAAVDVLQAVGYTPNLQASGGTWGPAGAAQAPIVRGQVVGVADHVNSQGDTVHSKYMETSLHHPVVRMDEMKEGQTVVAERAVVEDQFLVTLHDGYSESDLTTIASQDGAHISKRLQKSVYLVSMNPQGELIGPSLSPQFVSARERLKKHLQSIAAVTPRTLSRTPAGETGQTSNSSPSSAAAQ